MNAKTNKYWAAFCVVKFLYMFFAIFVYSAFTKLGDTDRYISGPTFGSLRALYDSTYMMDFFGRLFSSTLGSVLAHFPFLVASLYGIYYSLVRIRVKKNHYFLILVLLSLPSFGVWTSIASKEAVSVFFMGIIGGFLIERINQQKVSNKPLVALSLYLCLVFKPQYLGAIVSCLIFVETVKLLKLRAFSTMIAFLFYLLCAFLVLYLLRDLINELSFMMESHFSKDSSSTRDNNIWVEDYDFFFNAPYGIFVAFVGPTLSEAISRPIFLFVFFESMFILLLFLFSALKLYLFTLATGRVNVYYTSLFFIVAGSILFVHYPFGALNPGSAIRYRESFYAFLVVFFFFCYSKIYESPNSAKAKL